MANENWDKAKKIFGDAVKLAPDERVWFLDEVCDGDKTVRREVESLLASYDEAESFMETPAVGEVAEVIKQAKNLETGRCFGHYEIIRQIGAGGMGEVYLANDKKLDRQVAVKILNEKFSRDESNLSRFIQEAKAASALNHPNILVIHEIGEAGDVHFIVSEFIKGETLREIFKKKTLKLSEVLDVSIQIANALCTAHEAHLVHRDIKPENIMIRPDGFVKILDFGLAKLVEQKSIGFEDVTVKQNQTAKGVILGTVNYMSPEQAKGERVDGRTDIFSFGAVIYEMIAGRTPFAGDSISETFANLINAEPPPLSHFAANVPDELQIIIAKMLRKNKTERYQTTKDLLTDLKGLQKRIEFEAELERTSQPTKQAEADTQISKAGIFEEITSVSPNNLTGNLVPIVGREKEISHLKNLLLQNDARLVTMSGVGGTGKTRLAKAVAQEMLPDFSDGVFFVELAAITNPELVASTIAQPLGVKEAGGKPILEALRDYLRDKQMLIVADNFEQVIDAAPNIAELLAAAANLKILITSRVLLHLSAEREFVVPPLAVPDETSQISLDELSNYEAVKLFVERARNAKPNFALTNENANDVAEICARLDGLPLAIELAAARIKILSPPAILAKLENRLKLLTGGAGDLPARQQTMRGAVEWSYDLLNEDEKTLFRRLAVFAGGFTFEAAERVSGEQETVSSKVNVDDKNEITNEIKQPLTAHRSLLTDFDVLDLVTSLVDKSLLAAKEQADGETRFRMLEVVREYALESLEKNNEAEAMRRSHAAYFLALAEEAEPHLQDAESVKWLNRLEDEHDNLRAAIQWLFENEMETAARLAAAIRIYLINHNHLSEGREWLEAALERGDRLSAAARFKLLNGLGWLAAIQGDYLAARKMHEESLAEGRTAGDRKRIAESLRGLEAVEFSQGDHAAARKFGEEGLAIHRELGDKFGIACSLNGLGALAFDEGNGATARTLLEESLTIFRSLGYSSGLGSCLNNLSAAAYINGNYEEAREYCAEALTIAQNLGHTVLIGACLEGFAELAAKRGEWKLALRLTGTAENLREADGSGTRPSERRRRDAFLAELKTKIDEADFARLYEQGRKLKLAEAVALCLEENDGKIQTIVDKPFDERLEKSHLPDAENATKILQATTGDANKTTAETNYSFARQIKRHKPFAAVALLVLLAAIGFGGWYFGIRPADTKQVANTKQIESIAVLPFLNESVETQYLSDGMTETLISALSQLPNLNVKARSAVFRYKGKDTDAQEIGKELNVQTVLTGRVAQRGDDLTLSLSLEDVETGNQMWGKQYNRKLTGIIALQTEIARDVSDNLKTKLSGADERRLAKNYTVNPEAYQLYLKGKNHVERGAAAEIQRGISYFQQAIEIDPNYALAYSGLAGAYLNLALFSEIPAPEFLPKVKAAANKAIELDDTLAEVHQTLGNISFWYDWDFNAAEKHLKRALELNPNASWVQGEYAVFLSNTGRQAEALVEIKRAIELDPSNLFFKAMHGLMLIRANQNDEGLAILQQVREQEPRRWEKHGWALGGYFKKGMFPEAVALAREARELSGVNPMTISSLGEALAKAGKRAEARAVLGELLKLSKERFVSPHGIAAVYNALEERDETFAWLERGYEMREPRMVLLPVEYRWGNLTDDPRFQDLLRRMGLPQ